MAEWHGYWDGVSHGMWLIGMAVLVAARWGVGRLPRG